MLGSKSVSRKLLCFLSVGPFSGLFFDILCTIKWRICAFESFGRIGVFSEK